MVEIAVGREMPDFELPDQQGHPWSLSGQLEEGPVVLVFYRGDWCPYCNGQLVSYARNFEQFEGRGAQVVGVSVDPPDNNARMVGKLRLPYPLLSDARGDLSKLCGLWNAKESVAIPSLVVVDRLRVVRYLYAGDDFADRPGDDELFASLDELDGGAVHRVPGNLEVRLTAPEARRETVRPKKQAMPLEGLYYYYRGVYFATVALKKRFGRWGRSGRDAFGEVGHYQTMIQYYRDALAETMNLIPEEDA